LGRNGLAWGNGLHQALDTGLVPEKREGDGKSPAGMFALPFALGFDDAQSAGASKMPYVKLGDTVECIDFTDSIYYNQVLDWSPIEELRKRMDPNRYRFKELFRVGLFIGQNTNPVTPGAGSCVYLHLRAMPNETTGGCTAVDEPVARKLVSWLKSDRHPVFVLLPKREYVKYRKRWDLP
jgi:L,D-peptidoglycan transpeptidase YkuD (ErfK/YbiS/YcfS/YnhG family)